MYNRRKGKPEGEVIEVVESKTDFVGVIDIKKTLPLEANPKMYTDILFQKIK
jgi:hypothetical protein